MGLQIRGLLPDGTEEVFTLPDSGPTSTVDGWLQVVGGAGYQYLETIGFVSDLDTGYGLPVVDEESSVVHVISSPNPGDVVYDVSTALPTPGAAGTTSNFGLMGIAVVAILLLAMSGRSK